MRACLAFLLLLAGALSAGCSGNGTLALDDDDSTTADDDDATGEFEGDDPGECADGADNDQDGLFDCDDPDCAGAATCQGGDDDDSTGGDDDDSAGDDDDDSAGDDDDDSAGDDDDDSAGDDDDSTSAEDLDGDGWPASTDCDDGDATIHPNATEDCDAIDSDCDLDLVDEFIDTDGDGAPDCIDTDDDGDGYPDGVDCGPLDATVYPNAPETCDLIDSDCDGELLDGEPDLDGDGLPDCVDADADGDGVEGALGAGADCDDLDPDVFPGQTVFWATARSSGSWDYDCDGVETAELTLTAVSSYCPCYGSGNPNASWWSEGWICSQGTNPAACPSVGGWTQPACGATASYISSWNLGNDIACCPYLWVPYNVGWFTWSGPRTQGCR